MKKKNVVCFGGGNSIPKAILEPLSRYPVNITSISSMVDNGGSTGQLREDFDVLPAGDIRRHILALSNAPQWKKDLWNFRFGRETFEGGHKGHNFANVFMAGLEKSFNDYEKVLKYIHEFMEAKGQALPATLEKTHVFAELENGEIIEGEAEIDVPKKHNSNLKIKKIYLQPQVEAFSKTLEAVEKANLITIGPGDLYSSSIPCLLMSKMKEAFIESKAKKVLVVNTMTKLGETNNFSVTDFASEVEKYMGCKLDFVIYNSQAPSDTRIIEFKKEESAVIELVKINTNLDKNKFITGDLLSRNNSIIYDPEKLAKLIMSLI